MSARTGGVIWRRPTKKSGKTPERAEVWVRDKDELNTLRIERCRHKADLVVTP